MRPAELNFLFREVTTLTGVGTRTGTFLKKLCGEHLADVLFHIPVGVIHRPYVAEVKDIPSGNYATVQVRVCEHVPAYRRKPYRIIGEIVGTGHVAELVFFNYRGDYLSTRLKVGETYYISGKIERVGGLFKIIHPDYITQERSQIPEFEPIYPLSAGLTNKGLMKSVQFILRQMPLMPQWLDEAFLAQEKWPLFNLAITKIHHPESVNDLSATAPARMRLAYDELLANQLSLLLAREKQKRQAGISIPLAQTDNEQSLTACFLKNLPFTFTPSQQSVIAEIRQDLSSPLKMTRLLQGDVGSGKTVVALTALVQAVEAGMQGVFMAPTDILAHQHFESVQKMLQGLPVRVGLLTGREKGKKRQAVLSALECGDIDILIGTHAVFSDDVIYHKLAIAVIDEQHKFGVRQRLALMQKQKGMNVLVMTATPIPRTLALTAYGDMDVSVMTDKPANRKPIETRVLSMSRAEELAEKLKEKIAQAHERIQVYWVCPLVEESEKSDLMAAEKRYATLQGIFGARVGLVHGQMKGPEKDAVMARFAEGELDVLVATTVIEVGVDVKTASIMVIEQAERFGLAGLHQLRGRVGRGGTASVCLLLHGKQLTPTARERLKIMRETDNGFLIAEKDLELRGAGEILGARQSGFPVFKFADMSVHKHLLYTASKDAQLILRTDAQLKSPRGEALRYLLYLFGKDEQIPFLKAG